MRFLYTLVIYSLLPFVLLRLFFLGIKKPAYQSRWAERFGFFSLPDSGAKPVIWLHAVSVGEVNAATPILRRLLKDYQGYQILVTTVTPGGEYTLQQKFSKAVIHSYFPYDLPLFVKRFVRSVKPNLFITMETEIWPNLYHACKEINIPILIVNARLSNKSAKTYRIVSVLMKQTLSLVDLIAAQTAADAKRFISLGADEQKVVVSGNVKFDMTIPPHVNEQAALLRRYLSVDRQVWIAASTQVGEEEIVLQAHCRVLKHYQDAVLILVPRHPERAEDVAETCKKNNLSYVKRSVSVEFTNHDRVYLVDTLGELYLHYAASQIAFVGGSLVKTGGQNMMEPASLGIPVICGPHTYNFTEMTELLARQKVLIKITDAEELADRVCALFADENKRHHLGEKSRQIIQANKGNTKRLMKLISPYLHNEATY